MNNNDAVLDGIWVGWGIEQLYSENNIDKPYEMAVALDLSGCTPIFIHWFQFSSVIIFSKAQCGSWVEHIGRVERPQRESWGIQVSPINYQSPFFNAIYIQPWGALIFDHSYLTKSIPVFGILTYHSALISDYGKIVNIICTGLLVLGMSSTMLRSNISMIRKTKRSSSMKPHCDICAQSNSNRTWIHYYIHYDINIKPLEQNWAWNGKEMTIEFSSSQLSLTFVSTGESFLKW